MASKTVPARGDKAALVNIADLAYPLRNALALVQWIEQARNTLEAIEAARLIDPGLNDALAARGIVAADFEDEVSNGLQGLVGQCESIAAKIAQHCDAQGGAHV